MTVLQDKVQINSYPGVSLQNSANGSTAIDLVTRTQTQTPEPSALLKNEKVIIGQWENIFGTGITRCSYHKTTLMSRSLNNFCNVGLLTSNRTFR